MKEMGRRTKSGENALDPPQASVVKRVQAEQEPTRKDFEFESVTHHDYKKELVQAGPPPQQR